jgi:hypothetical protein
MSKNKEYVNPDGKIVDYLGTELKIGDVIIHGYRGKSSDKPFDCGVFIRESENSLVIAKLSQKWDTRDDVVRSVNLGKSSGLIQPLVIISNPLFSMHNERILNALKIIDHLKSNGTLPQDFNMAV